MRRYRVTVQKDATSALDSFNLESPLRQTASPFNCTITQSSVIEAGRRDEPVYRSKIEDAATEDAGD